MNQNWPSFSIYEKSKFGNLSFFEEKCELKSQALRMPYARIGKTTIGHKAF